MATFGRRDWRDIEIQQLTGKHQLLVIRKATKNKENVFATTTTNNKDSYALKQ